ncbi:ParB/RepB/Spo0J family partition protein [Streptomyces albus subsp. chlorinus]|uniref:ParB/RepB/Spo0J family partition protein n=1 Tax=Streptomyces albus TaxID=1888 RepID=UPI00156E388B|nr:ParB/RepB/Spo0J family partition protein [Streptomyces albus]NSC25739.1 ParB/RepB/Spo0J family partition protein [Streptomyces albus subsp. chlorinus]
MSGRVADQLGTGASFSRTRGGVSARRQAVAATTGAPTTGAPDSRLRTLPLAQLVPTRFNPRRRFGSEEDLREFGKRLEAKQLQPAVAVSRDAYLALWPSEEKAVGTAAYVLVNGERRYRASRAVGLPTLEVVVDDGLARSRGDFLDAVLSENNDREDLDPIERALGIRTMVDELGGKTKVAEYYGKSAGWVTQQMYLLNLVPELQELVGSGELPVRETRALVKLPPDEQIAAWRARSARREEERAQPKPRRRRAGSASASPSAASPVSPSAGPAGSSGFTAVKDQPSETAGAAAGPDGFTAVKPDGTRQHGASGREVPSLPDQRPAPAGEPEDVPWEDPEALCALLLKRLSRAHRLELTRLLLDANTAEAKGGGPKQS